MRVLPPPYATYNPCHLGTVPVGSSPIVFRRARQLAITVVLACAPHPAHAGVISRYKPRHKPRGIRPVALFYPPTYLLRMARRLSPSILALAFRDVLGRTYVGCAGVAVDRRPVSVRKLGWYSITFHISFEQSQNTIFSKYAKQTRIRESWFEAACLSVACISPVPKLRGYQIVAC